jgi:hypothetical protein
MQLSRALLKEPIKKQQIAKAANQLQLSSNISYMSITRQS